MQAAGFLPAAHIGSHMQRPASLLALLALALPSAVASREIPAESATAQRVSTTQAASAADAETAVSWGIASWYGEDFHGRRMANGDVYDMDRISVAHKTLPLGTRVRITNLANGRSVVAAVTDRGPYVYGRIIDLSRKAAQLIGALQDGLVPVRVEVLHALA